MDVLANISKSLQIGDDDGVAELTQEVIEQGVPPKRILDEGLIAGMEVVGERFKTHEIFLPEVLMAAKAMNAGMEKLRPLLIESNTPTVGTVVLGSVQGDLHDIGKNLVGIMLKGTGFEVIDLGSDVAPERFVDTALEHDASVIGMSALLTTTMPAMRKVIDVLEQRELGGRSGDAASRRRIRTIVGGAPVTESFARDIGADSYGFDAANAVERVKSLIGENGPSA
ncbi:MAG: corrinoid protein [Phycisphaerae bacterium]